MAFCSGEKRSQQVHNRSGFSFLTGSLKRLILDSQTLVESDCRIHLSLLAAIP